MAIYKKYFRLNPNRIFIYHKDSLSFKCKMIILCVYPELESNLLLSVCSSTFHSYRVLYFECVVLHPAFAAVFTYQSPFQLHVRVQHSSGALLVKMKVR